MPVVSKRSRQKKNLLTGITILWGKTSTSGETIWFYFSHLHLYNQPYAFS